MKVFTEIWLAYGQSDEYSFVFRKNTTLFNRRYEKIVTCVVSCFTSAFVVNFLKFFRKSELKDLPMFDGRCVSYPELKILRDYLSWRQVDCHINNLYNTCFWSLVNTKKLSTKEAQNLLKDTRSDQKNELLFKEFGINYNTIEPIYRKGTILIRKEVVKEKHLLNEEKGIEEEKEGENNKKKQISMKKVVTDIHEDLIGDEFWEKYRKELEFE